jgi:hypothetical protein
MKTGTITPRRPDAHQTTLVVAKGEGEARAPSAPSLGADPEALRTCARELLAADGSSRGAAAAARSAGRSASPGDLLGLRATQASEARRPVPRGVDGVAVLRSLATFRYGGTLTPDKEAKLREIQGKLGDMAERLARAKSPAEKARIVIDAFTHAGRPHPEDFLDATAAQHATVGVAVALMAAVAARAVLSVHGLPEGVGLVAGAALGATKSSDLSAVVHHAFDNWGFDRVPWLAKQAAEFLAHHVEPQAETQEAWALTAHSMAQSIAPIMVAALVADPGAVAGAFAATLALGSLMSTENHKMAHRTSKEVPLTYDILQLMGLSLDKANHRRHHSDAHSVNYAVVRNTSPDDGAAFRAWEALVYRLTGVEPNSWKHDPSLRVAALGPVAYDERAAAALARRDEAYEALKTRKRDQDRRLEAGEPLADAEVRITPRDLRVAALEVPNRDAVAPPDYEGASGGPFTVNLATFFQRR